MSCENIIYTTKGDTFSFSILVKADGVAVDLTGFTGVFTVKKTANDTLPTIQTNCTFPNPTGGELSVYFAPATMEITPGMYKWEIQLTDSGGERYTTETGNLEILKSLTIG